ncbi:MAG: PQQ-like beta-propeller repeat protein [Candidatus Coatesbacteria bacterium]|nr:PQQ-like beta-propeller repeat protein [Candidatus Coatesbacteria bacterium]
MTRVENRFLLSALLLSLCATLLADSALAQELEFDWTYDAACWITSAPLIGDDDSVSFGCHDGTVRVLDSDGGLLGLYQTGDIVCASPTPVSPGRIAVGSADGRLYCLTNRGESVWSYETGGPIYGSAAVLSDGRVVFGSLDGKIHCLTAEGSPSWSFETGGWVSSTPVVRGDDSVLFGSWDGVFYCLSSVGSVDWSYDVQSHIAASGALDDFGNAYFGTLDGRLVCLDSNGASVFEFQADDAVLSKPLLLPSGSIVFGDNDGAVYWLGQTGALQRTRRAADNVVAQPSLSPNGKIYVGSLDRDLYIFSETGSRVSNQTFPNAIIASVSYLSDGTPIVACLDGKIYALSEEEPQTTGLAFGSTLQVDLTPPISAFRRRDELPPRALTVPFKPTSLDEALFVMGCTRGDIDQKHELYYQDDCRLEEISYLLDNPLEVPQFAYGIVRTLTPSEPDLQEMLIDLSPHIDIDGISRAAFDRELGETPLLSSIVHLHDVIGQPLTPAEIEALSDQTETLQMALQKAAAAVVYGCADAYQVRTLALLQLDGAAQSNLFNTTIMPFASSYRTTEQLEAFLTSAKLVDMPQMVSSALAVLAAIDASVEHLALIGQAEAGVLLNHQTPIGRIIIGGSGPNTYGEDLGELSGPYLFLLDLGGDDTYLGESVGSTTSPAHGISVLIDASGDDLYSSGDRFTQGCGNLGVGLLLDLEGNDTYTGGDYSQGVASCGVGMLCDFAGSDLYFASNASQGAACFGLGILYDRFGEDQFYSVATSQGFGFIKGIGVLDGGLGDDRYVATGEQVDFREEEPGGERYDTMSQGFGWGYRNDEGRFWRSGGIGLLNDGGGSEVYLSDYFGQGGAYWFAAGVLYDRNGDDVYIARNYVQGAGTHVAVGILVDDAGDDEYYAWEHAQGAGLDLSVGILIEELGDDYYMCRTTCQGAGVKNAFGLLCDSEGNDVYAARSEHQGMGRRNETLRDYANVGLLLDFDGLDHYSKHSGQNRRWTDGYLGLAMDAESGNVPWKMALRDGLLCAPKDLWKDRQR